MEFLLKIPSKALNFIVAARTKLRAGYHFKSEWWIAVITPLVLIATRIRAGHNNKRTRTALLFLALATPISGLGQNVALIYDESSRYQRGFVETLSSQLSTTAVHLKHINSVSLSTDALKKDLPDIIISLNDQSSRQLIVSKLQTTTFHALTTLSRSRHIAPCLPDCLTVLPNHLFFVLDQPVARQLSLIKLINPAIKNIGLIVTEHSSPYWLPQQIKPHAYSINKYITEAKSIRYQIDTISQSSDAILAVADTDIYNASTLSQILLTSYRYKTPVIGFSSGFIKAGALSGTISTLQQLAQHLAECLRLLESADAEKKRSLIYPKYFKVVSNRGVAKSLNLHFPSDQKLTSILSGNETTR
ncbi:MAG: ABC transporter substrate-binding protein [Cycloclasticus sp.]|nr:ABC transporter substrate-binding protein [Cycloclasticus sp.]MBQ0789189.1 ABC transporter substrate-binding protein [Cycloclasticus sp.]